MELKLSHYTSQKPSRNIRFADLAFLTSFLAPVHVVNGGALRAPETTPLEGPSRGLDRAAGLTAGRRYGKAGTGRITACGLAPSPAVLAALKAWHPARHEPQSAERGGFGQGPRRRREIGSSRSSTGSPPATW